MTAPFCKTVDEVKANIKRIEHNKDNTYGSPTGIEGGSGGNLNSGSSMGVPNSTQGADYIGRRSSK